MHKKSTQSDRIIHTVEIDSLAAEDSGQYVCSWYFDKVLNQTITREVEVSPKKGQIKVRPFFKFRCSAVGCLDFASSVSAI